MERCPSGEYKGCMNRPLRNFLYLGLLALVVTCAVAQEKPLDFYGKTVSLLKVFGQRNAREAAAGAVTGANVYHASGVVVDRSLTPNPVYVFDSGNNRIL